MSAGVAHHQRAMSAPRAGERRERRMVEQQCQARTHGDAYSVLSRNAKAASGLEVAQGSKNGMGGVFVPHPAVASLGHPPHEGEGMVDAAGIEPATPSMSTRCSPAELCVRSIGERGVYPPLQTHASVGGAVLRQAAIIRSTSVTISRRWMGLERTLAPGGPTSPWAMERATAAKPVMNMMRMAG